MLNSIWKNTTYRFLLIFLGLFTFLYYFNIAYIGLVAKGGYYIPFLAEYLNYIEGLRSSLMHVSAYIIQALGEQVFVYQTWLRVAGRGGFLMAYDCLGFGVMSFLTAFVIAYPKNLKSKLCFLPAGLFLIQGLNVLRFVFLGLYWKHSHLKPFIDHHDLFNILLYIVLIAVIYLWINEGAAGRKGKES